MFHFDRASWIYVREYVFKETFDIRNDITREYNERKKRKKPEHPLSFLYVYIA